MGMPNNQMQGMPPHGNMVPNRGNHIPLSTTEPVNIPTPSDEMVQNCFHQKQGTSVVWVKGV